MVNKMVIYKAFFRKRKTKLYISTLVIMIFIMLFIFNSANYYSNLINNNYIKNSYFYTRYYDLLNENSVTYFNIINIEEVLLIPKENIFFSSNTDLKNEILVNQNSGLVIIYKDKLLKENSAYIRLSKFIYNTFSKELKNLNYIIFKKINNNIVLKSKETAKFAYVKVSEDIYNDIYDKSYVNYIFNTKNYRNINKILQKFDNKVNFVQNYEDNNTLETLKTLEKIFDILSLILIICGLAFFVIFIVIIRNIFIEEYQDMQLEWLLGYNHKKIRNIIVIKITLISILSFVISFSAFLLMLKIISFL